MSLEVKVPAVGESITEVTIAQWLKKDGDRVEMDEVIAELESDKATFELPAEGAGILRIIAQEGETIDVGAIICRIEEDGAGAPAPAAPSAEAASGTAAPAAPQQAAAPAAAQGGGETVEMVVPTVGESITEVTIASWLKNDGDHVEMDEVIAELESDKATFELPAEASGTLQIVAKQGDTIEIGATICKIIAGAGATQANAQAAAKQDAATQQVASKQPAAQPAAATGYGNQTYASGTPSPAAGKILSEKGISPSDVQGTGRDGRITKEDAVAAQKTAARPATAPAPKKDAAAEAPAAAGERNQRREKMSSLRKTVARRLVQVKNDTAMLTTFNEVDMKPIMDIRTKYKEKFKEKHEVGLGFMSFFTKACTVALQEWPAVNAQIDGNDIIFNDFCDVSIAVSSPKGLVVPVIRNAESLTLDGIEKEVVRLAKKARDGKLSIEEMTGGTFTITNGGVFGSMMSTPIINAPQSAILGMHNIVQRPVAIDGQVEIRPMMYLALSYDHRIIDGRESVSFLVRVKELLEDPMRLLLGV
ncbi:2-oxoglutarate dehydrogenase complex dihydrolipoyllysine-residue succinyltransferase [Pontibacter russatus]|uniref:2-oxoglutarate dehydrogenase complex dihydrolipoyllysine-residue succinyltransferase n=1 Tax=Pontibacter russatus TaxID=2694929 RepID=UPI00137A7619|nr:2-oxoglutarate dehydrogenase complex dihydrolipoyllysine-residue succinyltransferase [Pontibacter russatus]